MNFPHPPAKQMLSGISKSFKWNQKPSGPGPGMNLEWQNTVDIVLNVNLKTSWNIERTWTNISALIKEQDTYIRTFRPHLDRNQIFWIHLQETLTSLWTHYKSLESFLEHLSNTSEIPGNLQWSHQTAVSCFSLD